MNQFNHQPTFSPLSEVITQWSKWGGIYLIKCAKTGMTYLGSTESIRKRLKQHWAQLNRGKHPNKAMQQDFNQWGGQSFVVGFIKLVHSNYDRKQLYREEQDYLDVVKSFETRYYNQNHHCQFQTKTKLPKPVQAFIQQHVDPYNCARLTCDTFEVGGKIKTIIAYQFQDQITHYLTIEH